MENKELVQELIKFLRLFDGFPKDSQFTSLQIGIETFVYPHKDKNNVGPSFSLVLGESLEGGRLIVEGVPLESIGKVARFSGLQ